MSDPSEDWIAGFRRGLFSDPPDDCPDPNAKDAGPEYMVGWKDGKRVGSGANLRHFGGEVTVSADVQTEVFLDGVSIGKTVARHDHATGWHEIRLGDLAQVPIAFYADEGGWTETAIVNGQVSQVHK